MANIYIVEDDTNIQEIEAIALKNSGHNVEQFEDAKHFYKKIEDTESSIEKHLIQLFL